FFPRAEQERLKREYHSIRQTDTETSTAAFPLTCLVPRSSCWYCGGAGKELPVGSSQVPSSLGVPLRATHTRFALRVDADTQESVVEQLVPASSVVK
nr:hypothetical protein [Tanacetum cinerariifolium]